MAPNLPLAAFDTAVSWLLPAHFLPQRKVLSNCDPARILGGRGRGGRERGIVGPWRSFVRYSYALRLSARFLGGHGGGGEVTDGGSFNPYGVCFESIRSVDDENVSFEGLSTKKCDSMTYKCLFPSGSE